MKNNYYKLKNSKRKRKSTRRSPSKKASSIKRTSRSTSSTRSTEKARNSSSLRGSRNSSNSRNTRQSSNQRKRQNRQLNYKKVFAFLLIVILLFGLMISGCSKMFSKSKKVEQPVTAEPQKDITINMAVIGDIMCHTTNFADAYDKENDTYDFSNVFTDVKPYLQNADITIGNLETTFAGKEIGYTGYPTFNTPEQLAKNLKDIGIDVVSTANNHSLDKKYAGLVSTLDELDKVNISHTGTYRSKEDQNKIITQNVNGINIAFLSFTYGTNGIPVPSGKEYCINLIDEDLMLDQISRAKALKPDLICVSMHWGDEYKLKQNATQEKLADFLFKNGVDIIFGSHPHVLEPMEKRTIKLDDGSTKDGFVIYSLGNFMSGQVAENTMNSIILQLQVTKHGNNNKITIDSVNYVPIFMYDKGSGQTERYKILDIDKTIEGYKKGTKGINDTMYNKVSSAKEKIDKVLTAD